jgi:hypothetical protein
VKTRGFEKIKIQIRGFRERATRRDDPKAAGKSRFRENREK